MYYIKIQTYIYIYIYIYTYIQSGDTLAPYLFIICLDYVLRTSYDKIWENRFELTKKRSKRYPAKTITDTDYADDLALLANTPDQAETLLHSLERAAAVQIAFLKFTSWNNQALLGCIPIAAVAVHLNLKSWKLVSHLIRCIAITYWIFTSLCKF